MECGPEKCPIRVFSDLTPAEQRVERKRTAEKMTKLGFTQEQIAKQLGVSTMTVSRDLEGFNTVLKPPRPKGGRPKGTGKGSQRAAPAPHKKQPVVAALMDKGLSMPEIASEAGVGKRQVRHIVERVEIEREAVAKAEPEIDRSALSMSAQEKLDAAIRQHQRKLDAAFEQRVQAEARRRVDEIVLPHWKEKIDVAERILERRHGIMSKDTFNAVRRALHPDSRKGVSDNKLAEAFDAFMQLEKLLLSEKDSPTDSASIPSSLAEWDKMRVKRTVKKRSVSNVARRH